jgi:hypothetical protein
MPTGDWLVLFGRGNLYVVEVERAQISSRNSHQPHYMRTLVSHHDGRHHSNSFIRQAVVLLPKILAPRELKHPARGRRSDAILRGRISLSCTQARLPILVPHFNLMIGLY